VNLLPHNAACRSLIALTALERELARVKQVDVRGRCGIDMLRLGAAKVSPYLRELFKFLDM
jgi:hypothetical protein